MVIPRAIAALCLCLVAVSPGRAASAEDWPREVRSGDATIVLYQPQFDSLEGISTRARIAVAIRRPGVPPEFGALWVAATLDVDRDEDTARFETFTVERARFPDATGQEVKALTALIERTAPTWDLRLSLSELRAGLEAEGSDADPGFRNDPPRIIYRNRPAILVTLDGAPVLQPVRDTPYQRVSNTPFPIVFDPATRQYWLYGSAIWFTTRDLVSGRWSPRDSAPEGIARLFSTTAANPPVDPGAGVPRDTLRQAEIIVTTRPAELIVTDGEPEYRPLVGDEMLYVTNTGSDLFLEVPTKQYYVVLSGRWYRSRSLEGPWAYVDADRVPTAFASVPRKSDKAEVLAHVPGTEEAKDAIMDSMIPQTAAVRRSDARLEVTYDGTPLFEQIPGTSLLYARNTTAQVLKVDNRYYAVDQGIWYVADSAYGPWRVADSRPEDVERIPPSSPAYNVKYVYIYDYTPEIVYVGYLPGYTWAFPYRGAIVYGTGYYYRPWVSPVYYYPAPWTWGFQMHYDPWYGWGYGMSWTAGWSSFSYGWGGGWGGWRHGYRPGYRDGYWDGYNTGFWAGQHTGGWFGPGGYRPPHDPGPRRGFRPPERSQIGTLPGIGGRPSSRPAPGSNLYAGPGARPPGLVPGRNAPRPGTWTVPPAGSRPATRPENRPENRPDPRQPGAPVAGQPGRPADRPSDRPGDRRDNQPQPRPRFGVPNNVYVDRDGVPHRLTREGWQMRENRQWRPAPDVQAPSGQPPTQPPPRQAPPLPAPREQAPPHQPPPQQEPPQQETGGNGRPPRSGGWGNRAGPRDGPSLPAANQSRQRSHGFEGGDRR
jgi:hypothetical protein